MSILFKKINCKILVKMDITNSINLDNILQKYYIEQVKYEKICKKQS